MKTIYGVEYNEQDGRIWQSGAAFYTKPEAQKFAEEFVAQHAIGADVTFKVVTMSLLGEPPKEVQS